MYIKKKLKFDTPKKKSYILCAQQLSSTAKQQTLPRTVYVKNESSMSFTPAEITLLKTQLHHLNTNYYTALDEGSNESKIKTN